MSKLLKGILGPVTGKVGTVIGTYIRKKAVIKSLPIMPKRTTEAQDGHRAIFKLAGEFLTTLSSLLKKSFSGLEFGESAFSVAIKQVIEKAIIGTPPVIDYSKVEVANGNLHNVDSATLALAAGTLTFNWPNNADEEDSFATDRAILVAYCAQLKRCAFKVTTIPRSAGTAVLTLPVPFSGQVIQTWISFKSLDGKRAATSMFTGTVTAL